MGNTLIYIAEGNIYGAIRISRGVSSKIKSMDRGTRKEKDGRYNKWNIKTSGHVVVSVIRRKSNILSSVGLGS